MNRHAVPLILVLALIITGALESKAQLFNTAAKKEKAAEVTVPSESEEPNQMEDRWVVILGVYKDFHEAKADAQKFAKASKVPFTMDGRIFDKKGLRYPDEYEDEVFRGEYFFRRYNAATIKGREVTEYLSVEKSEAYEGLKPGFYIVVGSIAESAGDAKRETARFKSTSSHTYFKKARIYMGCVH